MAQSLISIITLATLVAASPVAKRQSSCVETWWSQENDTCDSIGAIFGLTGDEIFNANTYLNCNDIWVNTPVCIPYLPAVTTIFPSYYTPHPTTTVVTLHTTSAASCVETWWSEPNDTCDSIGSIFGLTGTEIFNANTYLNCSDIWVGTPVCIPYLPAVTTIFPSYVTPTPSTTVVFETTPASPANGCVETWWSEANDTCDSIGAIFGLTGTEIFNANTYLNCSDIWVNTPVCIPYLPAVTTIFPSYVTATPTTFVVETTSASGCVETWWSQPNDTCESIGAIFGLTGNDIFSANTYLNCSDIWVNTPVCIPFLPSVTTIFPSYVTPSVVIDPPVPVPSCSSTYTSVAGDTCESIGAPYGLTGDEIFQANQFLNCNDIWAWTPICIPYPVIVDPFPTD